MSSTKPTIIGERKFLSYFLKLHNESNIDIYFTTNLYLDEIENIISNYIKNLTIYHKSSNKLIIHNHGLSLYYIFDFKEDMGGINNTYNLKINKTKDDKDHIQYTQSKRIL